MNMICRACGASIDGSSSDKICTKCKLEFQKAESEILSSENKDYIRYCAYCGRPFEGVKYVTYTKTGTVAKRTTSRKFCEHDHYTQCLACGKPIKCRGDIATHVTEACSKSCRDAIALKAWRATCEERYGVDAIMKSKQFVDKMKSNCLEKYGVVTTLKLPDVRAKARKTCLDRYGVEFPVQSADIQQKMKETCLRKYGVEYAHQSDVVKDQVKQTCLDKYGVANPMQSKEVQDKVKSTCLQRYGTEYAVQSQEVQCRIKATNLDRYGVEKPLASKEIRDKRVGTWMNKYGVDHPLKVPEIYQKVSNTQKAIYGGTGNASSLNLAKYRKTSLDKYGVENPNQSEEFQTRKRAQYLENHGVDHPMRDEKIRDKVRWTRIMSHADTILDPVKRTNYIEFSKNPRAYILSRFDHKPSLIEISETLGGLDCTSISARIPPADHDLLGNYQTTMERHVCEFLKECIPDINIVVHDRNQIKPYEIDIYLPEYRVGIECNPTATHNSSCNCFSKTSSPIPCDYHSKKSMLCKDKEIRLFHIFGHEWTHKQSIIKSMLASMLDANTYRLCATDLSIKLISSRECARFLDCNHLDGRLHAHVKLGLTDTDGTLVSVMTFKKSTISTCSPDSDHSVWELSRFCIQRNTAIDGGAARLFNHFIRAYNPDHVLAFSDSAHPSDTVYETLGFKQSGATNPDYVWVDKNSDNYFSRIACQKHNLSRILHDPSIDIENEEESEIMTSHGFVQVFDSGSIKWIWTSSEVHNV